MMQIRTIRLREFRRFVEPFELTDLSPGLNLVTGPNEAGKSTLAAAVRAAFLERYRTGTVTDFAPFGVAGARPSVDIEFQLDGRDYALSKTFLTKARCELQVTGGERLEGDQAEEALARLLGFTLPARGQSRPEQAGVPGLLWIRQGDSGDRTPVQHAGTHVREALSRISGELASEEGDRLLARVEAERAALLDARGKPRAAYRETEEALAATQAERDRLREARAALDAAVDRLGTLRRAHADDEREKPWLAFEAQAAQARAREIAASHEKAQLDALLRERRQADDQIGLLQEQARRDQQDADELRGLADSVTRAREDALAAEQSAAGAQAARDTAAAALAAARARVDAVRAATERRDVEIMLARQSAETQRLARSLTDAQRLAARRDELERAQSGLRMEPADLKALRAASAELDSVTARRSAVATRLQFSLGEELVWIDGEPLPASGERLLTAATELHLAGGGRLRIVPGGADLAGLADAQAQAQSRQQRLLQGLGEDSLAAVEARFERLQSVQRDLQALDRELAIHAPQGLAALQALAADADSLCDRLRARLAGLDAPQAGEPVADAPALQADLQWAQQAVEQADAALAASRARQQKAAAQAEQLSLRRQALAQRLDDAPAQAARAERMARLDDTRSARAEVERRILAAQTRLAEHRPDLIQQDIERFERSARIARDAFQTRQRDMLLLQGRLDEAGAQGLGESLAQSEAEVERLSRRRDALAARAAALELLLSVLRARRDAATQRLLAPLTTRLEHYAGLLFPGGGVTLDDGFAPQSLRRATGQASIDTLSHGTQEQLGILARLAYADVLREAGRPTLIILDDALVHTDIERLGWMKRALFDAASRHQILVFTCHAPAWRDLGVVARSLVPEHV